MFCMRLLKLQLLILFSLFFYSQASFSDISYPNISHNETAQKLFNKGMLNYYAYLYVQAENDFKQALAHDANCAMCYWGIALTNKQEAMELNQPFATVGFENIRKANKLIGNNDSFYHDVIKAAQETFSLDPKRSSQQLQIQYINTLRKIQEKYKHNNDWKEESLALFVDAIAYYSHVSDDNDYKHEAVYLLTSALKDPKYRDHPGLLHTYIHLMERNLTDPLSLVAAKKLSVFSHNEIAHYTHMPNHIYWRRGMYKEAIQANLDAIAIDEHYFKCHKASLDSYYYEYHYLHSHHFLTALGILTHNYDLAIQYARAIKKLMHADHMDNLKDYRDTFLSLEHIVLARFKKWQNVLDLEIPIQADALALLLVNFTRSLAYLNLGQMQQFKALYQQIKNKKYTRKNMIEIQTLVVSYLKASELRLQHVSCAKLKQVFISKNVDLIENKLEAMNPPLWFFPYREFLSEKASCNT